jgi:hypothetical protein
MSERIEREIGLLKAGGQRADLVAIADRQFVIYYDLPTDGVPLGLPGAADVIVPVPQPYPPSMIDGAGLVAGSPLIARVRGGQNNQGIVDVGGRRWQFASYHPHNGGGGPAWNPTVHGFHTYVDHLLAWLARLS